jgi:conjugative transfer signal peptidase TraF
LGTLARLAMAAAVAAAAASALATHLLVNVTPSAPLGLYWMRFGGSPERGELVAFRVPPSVRALVRDRHYLPDGALLLKPVAAVAGDVVCIEGDELRIEGQARARLRSVDTDGRSLPRDARCGPLTNDQVYALSHDLRSFDSRVFGPIAVGTLYATVTPLWTF